MTTLSLPRALEALLVALDRPLAPDQVAPALGVQPDDVVDALAALSSSYAADDRGFALRQTAAGWSLYAVPAAQELLERVVRGDQTARLSNAALETLAVVAYQQPVSRSRVAAVRGVSVDAVMRTLGQRGLVQDVGVDEVTGAVLYGTTPLFLTKLGVSSLDDLPDLAPLLPDLLTAQALHDDIST